MNFSCLGVLKPTHKMSGCVLEMVLRKSLNSPSLNARNGGVNVPAISIFGNFAFNFCASKQATPSAPP